MLIQWIFFGCFDSWVELADWFLICSRFSSRHCILMKSRFCICMMSSQFRLCRLDRPMVYMRLAVACILPWIFLGSFYSPSSCTDHKILLLILAHNSLNMSCRGVLGFRAWCPGMVFWLLGAAGLLFWLAISRCRPPRAFILLRRICHGLEEWSWISRVVLSVRVGLNAEALELGPELPDCGLADIDCIKFGF